MMRKRFCLTFAGQNTQHKEMWQPFVNHTFFSKYLSNEHINRLLFKHHFVGSYEAKTSWAQPAVLLHSVMLYDYMRSLLPSETSSQIDVCLGHSLGEYSAFCVSSSDQVLSLENALRIVHLRGLYMEEELEKHGREFAMTALLLFDQVDHLDLIHKVNRITQEKQLLCDVANLNSDKQIVLSGWKEDVGQTVNQLKEEGLKCKAVVLQNVAAPFHSQILRPVAPRLHTLLNETIISHNPLSIPIVSNVTSNLVYNSEDIVATLPDQVYKPVRWTESIRTAYQHCRNSGDSEVTFIEISPKPVLTAFTKSILGDKVKTLCLSDPSQVDQFCASL